LKRWNIVAIEGIDTRALVRHIRDKGAMRACLSTIDLDEKSLVEKARQSPPMENRELASVVTTKEPYDFPAEGEERFHVVCYDFGVKRNSLRELAQLGVRTTVVPATTSAADALLSSPTDFLIEWSRRSGFDEQGSSGDSRVVESEGADVRDLFWAPIARTCLWRNRRSSSCSDIVAAISR
jgi:hypothetical protein